VCTQTLPLSCEDREAASNRLSAQEDPLKAFNFNSLFLRLAFVVILLLYVQSRN